MKITAALVVAVVLMGVGFQAGTTYQYQQDKVSAIKLFDAMRGVR